MQLTRHTALTASISKRATIHGRVFILYFDLLFPSESSFGPLRADIIPI